MMKTIRTLFVVLFCAWCALVVNGGTSNDLGVIVKEMKRAMSRQHSISEKLYVDIGNLYNNEDKLKKIIEKQGADIGNLNNNEDKLKKIIEKQGADIGNLYNNEAKLKKIIEKQGADIGILNNNEVKQNGIIEKLIESEQALKLRIKSCCTMKIGKSKKSPAKSCKWLREISNNVESGLFWISLEYPTKVYCDMDKENDGGGWTMIGQAETRTDAEGDEIDYPKIISNNIGELSNVVSKRFLLSSKGLRGLQQYINFTQIRFFCHKPWHGRTFHIYTMKNGLGKGVVDLMTEKSDKTPKSCNSYARMNNDNSILGSHCQSWYEQKWNGDRQTNAKMYDAPIFINFHNHFYLASGRVECDDYIEADKPRFNKIGRWAFYVR